MRIFLGKTEELSLSKGSVGEPLIRLRDNGVDGDIKHFGRHTALDEHMVWRVRKIYRPRFRSK